MEGNVAMPSLEMLIRRVYYVCRRPVCDSLDAVLRGLLTWLFVIAVINNSSSSIEM